LSGALVRTLSSYAHVYVTLSHTLGLGYAVHQQQPTTSSTYS
jgi:hypothetical protein